MIYCVEDDNSIRELLVYTLNSVGMKARGYCDGKSFFDELSKQMPSLVILDIMLPDEDGIQILKRLKSSSDTKHLPVIMLTAKGAEYDKVLGFESGADDYVTKPFGMMELVSRIKAVLRRSGIGSPKTEIEIGGLLLNADKHLVFADGKQIDLTLKEFNLLRFMMENRGTVLTRDKLLETLWGYEFGGETRTVDVHIRTLRQKLGKLGEIIETVRGVGYRIGGKS